MPAAASTLAYKKTTQHTYNKQVTKQKNNNNNNNNKPNIFQTINSLNTNLIILHKHKKNVAICIIVSIIN